MDRRTLILTIDMAGVPEYMSRALSMQMADWLKVNKSVLPIEDLVIMPSKGDTKLYWLQGSVGDAKTLEEIKDRIEPVLQVALNLKIDKDKKYKSPHKQIRDAFAKSRMRR